MVENSNSTPNSTLLADLHAAIERDPATEEFILWGENGRVLTREKTREDALRVAARLRKERRVSIEGNRVKIEGQVLPLSEYVELSSMREYQ